MFDVDDPGPARTARHLLRQGLQIGLRVLPDMANSYLPAIAPITLDIRPEFVSSGVSVGPSRSIPVFSRAFARREANFTSSFCPQTGTSAAIKAAKISETLEKALHRYSTPPLIRSASVTHNLGLVYSDRDGGQAVG